jgi:hypothetical protein
MLCRVLSRERGMTFTMVDKLVDALGMEVVIRPKTMKGGE